MFTGIVQATGEVREVVAGQRDASMVIDAGRLDLSDVRVGDSIAAGPYQAIPQPGIRWQPVGRPARYPHEHVRHGAEPAQLIEARLEEIALQVGLRMIQIAEHVRRRDDLRLVDQATKRVFYLDPKLYAVGSRDSSFRNRHSPSVRQSAGS